MKWRTPRPLMLSPLQAAAIALWIIVAETIQNDIVLAILGVALVLTFFFGTE